MHFKEKICEFTYKSEIGKTWLHEKKKGGGDGSKSQIQRSITVKYKNKRLLDGSSTPEHCNAFIHSTDDSQC